MNSINQILKFYSKRIGSYNFISELPGHGINSKNFLVRNFKKDYFVIKWIKGDNGLEIERTLRLQLYCFEQGAKIPEVILADDNNLLRQERNSFFFIQKYYQGKSYQGDIEKLRSAARHLGKLHAILKNYKEDIYESNQYDLLTFRELDLAAKFLESHKRIIIDDGDLREVLDLIRQFRNKLKEINISGITRQLGHRDFHPDNAVFSNKNLKVILDLQSIVHCEKIRCVGFASHRFAQKTKNLIFGIYCFLNEYNKKDSLTDKEINLVFFYTIYEAIKRLCFITRRYCFYHDNSWNFMIEIHKKNILQLQQIQESIKNINLDELKYYFEKDMKLPSK